MAIEDLDNLQKYFPGCDTIAFADVSTGMVLVTNSNSTVDRKALDDLCAEARILLSVGGKPVFGSSISNTAVRRSVAGTFVFVRSAAESTEALISICAPTIDVGGFISAAQICLRNIESS